MGTPIVDRGRLAAQLAAMYRNPRYVAMIQRLNLDRRMYFDKQQRRAAPGSAPGTFTDVTADSLAADAVESALGAVNKPNLLDPIVAEELTAVGSSIFLYRLFDGISGATALTLGRWWAEPALMQDIWNSTSRLNGQDRQRETRDRLRTAMFVHPQWNMALGIARMEIPPGNAVPCIIGRGAWTAMQTLPGGRPPKDPKTIVVHTEGDVLDKLGMVPIPGYKQVFVPMFSDMWVSKIPDRSPNWPMS